MGGIGFYSLDGSANATDAYPVRTGGTQPKEGMAPGGIGGVLFGCRVTSSIDICFLLVSEVEGGSYPVPFEV